MNKQKDRFDLEQEIMGVWHIIDDLQLFLNNFDSLSHDKKLNILIGLIDLYSIKFNDMFSTFEQCIANSELNTNKEHLIKLYAEMGSEC